MRNATQWKPTKFVIRGGRLRAQRSAVGPGSLLTAELSARWFDSTLPKYARGHVLDLGCGEVPLFGHYVRLIEQSTCVDWKPNLHVDLVADLGKPLCFPDDSFDTVLASDVLEHLPDPSMALQEICRVLRPGGALITNTPFLYWIHEEPFDFQRITEHGLRRLLSDASLNVVAMDRLGGALEVVADILAKLCAYSRVLRPISLPFQRVMLLLLSSSLGDRVRRKSSPKFPLSYGVVAVKPRNMTRRPSYGSEAELGTSS